MSSIESSTEQWIQVSPGGFNGGLVIMLRGRKAGTLRLAPVKHFRCVYMCIQCFMLWLVRCDCCECCDDVCCFGVAGCCVFVVSLSCCFSFSCCHHSFYLILLFLSFFLLEVAVGGGTGRLCFSGWALLPCGGDRLAIGSRSLLLGCCPCGLTVLHCLALALFFPTISRPEMLFQ